MKQILPALFLLAACQQADETLAGHGALGQWQLTEINGSTFTAAAMITFHDDGTVTGRAPCNSFGATQSAPYPWFELSPIRATKRACNDLSAESAFLTALQNMTLSEVSGNILILSNDTGQTMEFIAVPAQ